MTHIEKVSRVSVTERVEDLIRRMTIDEKVAQLTGVMPQSVLGANGPDADLMGKSLVHGIGHVDMLGMMLMRSPRELAETVNGIQRHLVERTRLGIPAILHGEAIGGFIAPGFSAFPTAIGSAATWEPEDVERMADIIRQQMRAVGFQQALSPVLDIARDARWGRVHETYGEDPYLTSAMGVAFTRGIQGSDLREGVIATAKHFLGYGLTEAGENMAATHLGARELYDVFATPFEAAIKLAGLRGIMNSYSEIDGVPVVADPAILRTLLREKMGFEGTVVSDYASVEWVYTRQGAARSLAHAGVLSLQAGLDVELPTASGYGAHFADAISEGRLEQSLLDDAVRRCLRDKFELGLFDQPFVREFITLPRLDEGRKLSRELAQKSLTLLANGRGILPLSKTLKRVAVIGPHATAARANFSAYTFPAHREQLRGMVTGDTKMAGIDTFSENLSPEAAQAMMDALSALVGPSTTEEYIRREYDAIGLTDALRLAAPEVEFVAVEGTGVVDREPQDIPAAVAAAQDADLVILAIGGRSGWFGTTITEGEASDSSTIELPRGQRELAMSVAATGTPIVSVAYLGRPYGLVEIEHISDALLAVYYPGPEGSEAIAATLFGDDNPGGKLPYTLPRSTGQIPIYHYQKRGSGYRRNPKSDLFDSYLDESMMPLYPFGHGLSYTEFRYVDLRLSAETVDTTGSIRLEFDVTNIGDVDGDEVVQVYFGNTASGLTRPAQQLVGFKRERLAAGKTSHITFDISMRQLGYTGLDGRFIIEPGPIDILIGSSSEDIRLRNTFEVVGATLDLAGRREYLSVATSETVE